jgi:hypothetical protein
MRLGWFVIALVIFVLAVDGGVSRTEALDRWVGTAVASAGGITVSFDFIVLVNPGIGASWEWRFLGVQILSGSLAATVSGSTVNGTAFVTGGVAFVPGILPCNFTGNIAGNRVDGTFDPASCGGEGTFVLVKQ